MANNPQDWQKIAAQIAEAGAPLLGGVLGGPLGSAVGGVVGQLIGGALGVPATPDAISAAIKADPIGAAAKLAPVEATSAPGLSALQLQLADVQNARLAEISYTQSASGVEWGAPVVSGIIVVGFVFVCGWAIEHPIADNPTLQILLGALAAAFGTVTQFWLGSSSSSKGKDATLSNALQSLGAAAATAVRKI